MLEQSLSLFIHDDDIGQFFDSKSGYSFTNR